LKKIILEKYFKEYELDKLQLPQGIIDYEKQYNGNRNFVFKGKNDKI
jgi:hypothetical protein